MNDNESNVNSNLNRSGDVSTNNKKKTNLIKYIIFGVVAVIVLVVIIFVVSKPLMENSRKSKFIKTVKEYADGTKSMFESGKLSCGGVSSSEIKEGYYYVIVDTSKDSKLKLVDGDGMSPWDERDIRGYVSIKVTNGNSEYYSVLVDGIHGVNVTGETVLPYDKLISSSNISTDNLIMSDAKYENVAACNDDVSSCEDYSVDSPAYSADLNNDGDMDDIVDGVFETVIPATLCDLV